MDILQNIKNIVSLEQNQFFSSELLAQFLTQPLIKNSIVRHVRSVPMACRNCPYLQTSLNCNQCNRWNQQEE